MTPSWGVMVLLQETTYQIGMRRDDHAFMKTYQTVAVRIRLSRSCSCKFPYAEQVRVCCLEAAEVSQRAACGLHKVFRHGL